MKDLRLDLHEVVLLCDGFWCSKQIRTRVTFTIDLWLSGFLLFYVSPRGNFEQRSKKNVSVFITIKCCFLSVDFNSTVSLLSSFRCILC